MVARSAAQRSETTSPFDAAHRHDGWQVVRPVTGGVMLLSVVRRRGAVCRHRYLEEVHAAVLQGDVGAGRQIAHGPGGQDLLAA